MNVEVLLLIVFVGAFLSPLFARLLKMPVPVGELVFGLLLGLLIGEGKDVPEVINFLAEFGFLLLMFLAGLEVDFNLLEDTDKKTLGSYTLYAFLIFLLAGALSFLLGVNMSVFIILSLISVGLMVATLKDMGMLSSSLAKRVMIIGVIGEIISLFALTFMEKVGRFHSWKSLLAEMGIILVFLLGFFVIFRLVKLLVWWFPEVVKKLTYEEDPSAISVRLSFLLMFSTAVLAHMSGLESVIGAFLAGIVFSFFVRKKHDLEEKLSSIGYGFLIPIFFIKTGMAMHLSQVNLELLGKALLFLAIILIVRLLPSGVLLLSGYSLKELPLSAVLLAYPFTLMIAAIEIARSSGLIGSDTSLSLFITATLSSLLFPWLAKALSQVLR